MPTPPSAEHQRPLEDRCLLEAGERPVPAWSAASETARPVGTATRWARRRCRRRSLRRARRRPGSRTAVGAPPDGIAAPPPSIAPPWPVDRLARLLGTVSTVENRKNDRPAVRNRSPIDATLLRGGMGSGIRSASGPEAEQELGAERRGQRDVEHGPERTAQPGRLVRGQPDRHVAAVDHDHERVAGDADERERHARVAAVLPEREQQQPVREAEQRQAQLADEVDAVDDRRLGREPEDDAREQQRQELEADVRQPLDPSAEEEAEQRARRRCRRSASWDSGWATAAMSGVSGECRTRPTESAPERSAAGRRAKRWGRPLSSDPPSPIPRGRP